MIRSDRERKKLWSPNFIHKAYLLPDASYAYIDMELKIYISITHEWLGLSYINIRVLFIYLPLKIFLFANPGKKKLFLQYGSF